MKKVAVVGLGNISTRHRRNLKQLFPQVTLYAMSASGRVPSESVSDCDQIVAGIDELIAHQVELVIIASPAPFHASHALPLIKSGIPVLIEKPVTTTLEDVTMLMEAGRQYRTPVTVGYCLRYLPSAKKLKQLLSQDAIGTLYNAFIEVGQYLPDWRPSKDYCTSVSVNPELGGGALFELSHELDYAQWLLGPLSLKHAILRSSQELGLEVEDLADVTTLTASGAVTHIHLDFLQRQAYRRCRFVGSLGCIEWDLIQNQLVLTHAGETTVLYSDPDWDKNQMYLGMVEDFIHKIERQPNQCIVLEEAMNTIQLIASIKSLAKNG